MDFVSDITLEDLHEIGITKLGTNESNSEMFGLVDSRSEKVLINDLVNQVLLRKAIVSFPLLF